MPQGIIKVSKDSLLKVLLAQVQHLYKCRILTFVTLSEVEVWQMLSSLKVLLVKASTSLSLTICTNTEHITSIASA